MGDAESHTAVHEGVGSCQPPAGGWLVPGRWVSSWSRARASEVPGSTLAEGHPQGSALTPAPSGACWRRATPYAGRRVPITVLGLWFGCPKGASHSFADVRAW